MLVFEVLARTAARLALAQQLVSLAVAQSFLPRPEGVTLIESKNYPGSSISYKQTSICETTPGVKGYSGYVSIGDDNFFFWYFDARNDPANAPVTIYLPGGPGTSFLDDTSGLPCSVNADSNSTTLNPWSWNNDVNMLYIDQPIQTGYSYTKPQDGMVDLFTGEFTPLATTDDPIATNLTALAATLSSQSPSDTVNTTAQAARMMWKFAQIWFQEFPEYKTTNDEVNLWSFSYGGFFGPGTFSYFQQQNERIANGTSDDPKAKPLRLGTLGINNGCIDSLIEGPEYPEMAVNNTYGIQAIPTDVYQAAKHNMTKEGDGCVSLIGACRAAAAVGDPEGMGNNDTVNEACQAAMGVCFGLVQGAYTTYSNRSPFDLAVILPGVFLPESSMAFYNQRWVQEALGVPVNFTYSSNVVVGNFFQATGDPMRRTIADLEHVLSAGVNLALVYGDRDYRCNWRGAEKVSLAMSYPSASSFRAAGYANITTNASYTGGVVRQHGNVSFSRVFQSGHPVAAYQPETMYRIFRRAISGRDIATGEVAIKKRDKYSSAGPESSFEIKLDAPPSPPSVCYLYDISNTCRLEEVEALRDGTAVVENFVVVGTDGSTSEIKNGAGRGGVSMIVVSFAMALVLGCTLS